MGHKDRDRHVFEDVPGGPAEKKFSRRGVPIWSHDDEVIIRLPSDIQYSCACLPIMGLKSLG